MIRLFAAIDFPDSINEQMANICHSVRGARWTLPHQFHLTLAFIGEVDDNAYYDIKDSLAGISMDAFDVKLKATGFFPPRKQPRVLWAGVEQNELLAKLQISVVQALQATGIEPEKRKFHPHITLARLHEKTKPDDIIPFLSATSLFKTEPVRISEFLLYSSVLQPDGAVHQVEETYRLGSE